MIYLAAFLKGAADRYTQLTDEERQGEAERKKLEAERQHQFDLVARKHTNSMLLEEHREKLVKARKSVTDAEQTVTFGGLHKIPGFEKTKRIRVDKDPKKQDLRSLSTFNAILEKKQNRDQFERMMKEDPDAASEFRISFTRAMENWKNNQIAMSRLSTQKNIKLFAPFDPAGDPRRTLPGFNNISQIPFLRGLFYRTETKTAEQNVNNIKLNNPVEGTKYDQQINNHLRTAMRSGNSTWNNKFGNSDRETVSDFFKLPGTNKYLPYLTTAYSNSNANSRKAIAQTLVANHLIQDGKVSTSKAPISTLSLHNTMKIAHRTETLLRAFTPSVDPKGASLSENDRRYKLINQNMQLGGGVSQEDFDLKRIPSELKIATKARVKYETAIALRKNLALLRLAQEESKKSGLAADIMKAGGGFLDQINQIRSMAGLFVSDRDSDRYFNLSEKKVADLKNSVSGMFEKGASTEILKASLESIISYQMAVALQPDNSKVTDADVNNMRKILTGYFSGSMLASWAGQKAATKNVIGLTNYEIRRNYGYRTLPKSFADLAVAQKLTAIMDTANEGDASRNFRASLHDTFRKKPQGPEDPDQEQEEDRINRAIGDALLKHQALPGPKNRLDDGSGAIFTTPTELEQRILNHRNEKDEPIDLGGSYKWNKTPVTEVEAQNKDSRYRWYRLNINNKETGKLERGFYVRVLNRVGDYKTRSQLKLYKFTKKQTSPKNWWNMINGIDSESPSGLEKAKGKAKGGVISSWLERTEKGRAA